MLDYRIHTFLSLCETMNYRRTAQELNMTQPAVTQHIQHLERVCGCRLFIYDGRTLTKTRASELLERHARAELYDERALLARMGASRERPEMRIGATKTIGDYIIPGYFADLLRGGKHDLSLTVDNTERLLALLDNGALDFALIEGFFDKTAYGWRLFRREKFVGICSRSHPFAGRDVSFDELFSETLILREQGSGTRAVFEQELFEANHSVESFRARCCVNSFSVTRRLVAEGLGVSFVYKAIADFDKRLAVFSVENREVYRDMNYVYLRDCSASEWVDAFEYFVQES